MHPLVNQLCLLDLKPVGEGEKEREGRAEEQRKVKFAVVAAT